MTPDMVRIFCTTYQQQREMCLSYSFSTNSNGQIHWNTPKASAELKDKLMPHEAHTQTWPHLLFGS